MFIAQFSYATVAAPGPYSSADGWKIKEVDPENVDRSLIEKAASHLGSFNPERLSLTATREQQMASHRRLRIELIGDDVVVLIHQISAGLSHRSRDSSFAHALVARTVDGQAIGLTRPADYWGAQGWLTPLGSKETAEATLGDLPQPPISGALSAPATPADERIDTEALGIVLAAATEDMLGTRPQIKGLVIGDDVGALTAWCAQFLQRYLMPAVAWSRLPFSTHEENGTSSTQSLTSIKLIGVPTADVAGVCAALGAGWWAIDPVAPPAPTDEDRSSWLLPWGGQVTTGPWARLVGSAGWFAADTEVSLTGLIDQLAQECRGTADDAPLWALAVSYLISGRVDDFLWKTRGRDAAELALRDWPPGLDVPPETLHRLVGAMTDLGAEPLATFEKVLRAVDQAHSRQSMLSGHPAEADLALDGYLRALWGPPTSLAPREAGAASAGASAGTRTQHWTHSFDAMPYLPVRIVPSQHLAEQLMEALPDLTSWIATEPIAAQVRLLASVACEVDRCDRYESLWVHETLVPRLADAVTDSMGRNEFAVDGGWPTVPRWIGGAIVAGLRRRLDAHPGMTLTSAAAQWLDRMFGPVFGPDDNRPPEEWTPLDLERCRWAVTAGAGALAELAPEYLYKPYVGNVLSILARQDRGTDTRQDRINHTAADWDTWLAGAVQPPPDVATWLRVLDVLDRRGIQAPLIEIALLHLSSEVPSLETLALADWTYDLAHRSRPTREAMARAEALLRLHRHFRPSLPEGLQRVFDGWGPETQAIVGSLQHARDPLRLALERRLGRNLAELPAEDVYLDSSFGVVIETFGRNARASWDEAVRRAADLWWKDLLDRTDQLAELDETIRLKLARSLFVRSMVFYWWGGERAKAEPVRRDVLGPWLKGAEQEEWPVEAMVHTLLMHASNTARSAWPDDVMESIAFCMNRLGAGNTQRRQPDGRQQLPPPLVDGSWEQITRSNAERLAVGKARAAVKETLRNVGDRFRRSHADE